MKIPASLTSQWTRRTIRHYMPVLISDGALRGDSMAADSAQGFGKQQMPARRGRNYRGVVYLKASLAALVWMYHVQTRTSSMRKSKLAPAPELGARNKP